MSSGAIEYMNNKEDSHIVFSLITEETPPKKIRKETKEHVKNDH